MSSSYTFCGNIWEDLGVALLANDAVNLEFEAVFGGAPREV